jgi:hypothetical protein
VTVKDILLNGDVEYIGRIVASSNNAILIRCSESQREIFGIYKPKRFERPLWDFSEGLYKREYLTFLTDKELGFDSVPETVIREDLEFGIGSVQHFLTEVKFYDYFEVLDHGGFVPELFKIAILDLIINNADRKAGHILVTNLNKVYAIDNGLSFNSVPKLRTVMWDFVGKELSEEIIESINRLLGSFAEFANEFIDADEIKMTLRRAMILLDEGIYPDIPEERRSYPWPIF